MHAELDVTTEPARWDAEVQALGGGCFHSHANAAVEADGRLVPIRIRWRDAGRTVGMVTGARTRSRFAPLGRLRDSLTLTSAPVVHDGSDVVAIGASLLALAQRMGVRSVRVETYDAPEYLRGNITLFGGVRQDHRLEFRVPLGGSWDQTLAAMAAGHRRNVRKGEAAGLAVRCVAGMDGARIVGALQEGTYARRQAIGHTHAHRMDAGRYDRALAAWTAAGAESWIAFADETPVSGLVLTRLGPRAYYLVGGTSPAGFERRAPFAVFGAVFRALIASGARELNLGGTPLQAEDAEHPDHGLYRFKRDFGAQTMALHSETAQIPLWGPRR